MRKILIISACILSVALLDSCKKRDVTIYVYKNISGVDITIECLSFKINGMDVSIPNNESYSYEYTHYPRELSHFDASPHVRIIFAGEKEIIFQNSSQPSGVYDLGMYSYETINEHKQYAYYYFTPEMYEQATPIER